MSSGSGERGGEQLCWQELEAGGLALDLNQFTVDLAKELGVPALAWTSDAIVEDITTKFPGARVASSTFYAIGSQPYQPPAPPPGSTRFIFPCGRPAGSDACHLIMRSGRVSLPMSHLNGLYLQADLFGSGGAVMELPPGSAVVIADCRCPSVCAAEGCNATAGLKKCSGCRSVRYCSREHQVAHWAAHKHECRRRAAALGVAAEAAPAAAEAAEGGAAEAGPAAGEAAEGGAAEGEAARKAEAANASAADAEE